MTTTSRSMGNPAATGGGTASVGCPFPGLLPRCSTTSRTGCAVRCLLPRRVAVHRSRRPHAVRDSRPVEWLGGSHSAGSRVGAITPMPRADVPASLVAVLNKGMANDPDDRFATAVEFGRALQRVEVELAYPQTPLDIPNLAIDRPERAGDGDESSADETRARVIPTIRAQVTPPIAPAPVVPVVVPAAPTPAVPTPAETVVRRPAAPVEQTQLRRPGARAVRDRAPGAVGARGPRSPRPPRGDRAGGGFSSR